MNENHPVRFEVTMAGIPGKGGVKGRSGPPGNQNAFKHGLAAIQKRREESVTTEHEESIRQEILDGLMIGLNDLQYEFETKIEVQCSPFSIC
jgi:uncharacterized protein YjcR